jgi:hypothetical protein
MNKISSMVQIKRITAMDGKKAWTAVFRGTNNMIKTNSGIPVIHTKKSHLLFDLKNNPMERGVLAVSI